MAGPVSSIAKGWELIGSKLTIDPPTPLGKYLGCEHYTEENQAVPDFIKTHAALLHGSSNRLSVRGDPNAANTGPQPEASRDADTSCAEVLGDQNPPACAVGAGGRGFARRARYAVRDARLHGPVCGAVLYSGWHIRRQT